ncbi:MAG: hypothetical protein AAGD01_01600 [Acidobacteriota bacterium]
MKITRIVTAENGESHFVDDHLELTDGGEIGRLSALIAGDGVIFRETGADYDFDWHNAPQRQFVVLLNGAIEIETGDGAQRRFQGGDVLLVEDVSGRGHRTRNVGETPRRSLFLPVHGPLP